MRRRDLTRPGQGPRPRPGLWSRSIDLMNRRPLLGDSLLAAAVAALLGTMSLQALISAAGPAGPGSTAARIGVVMALCALHAAPIMRRSAPAAGFVVAAAAMLLLALLPPITSADGAVTFPPVALPSGLVFFVALQAIARHGAGWIVQGALAVSGVGALVVALAPWGPTLSQPPSVVWRAGIGSVLGLCCLLVWLEGRLGRGLADVAARERARDLEAAARAERDRISAELHDIVSHSLAIMVSHAEGGRMRFAEEPAGQVFATIGQIGREALGDMRSMLDVLQTGRGETPPPSPAAVHRPSPGLADLDELLERVGEAGVAVMREEDGARRTLRPALQLAAYRVVQESITNVTKHAGPGARVALRMSWRSEALEVEVVDDGGGAGPGQVGGGSGSGLAGMRSRVESIGGRLQAGPHGRGFRVAAWLPYGPAAPGVSGRSAG